MALIHEQNLYVTYLADLCSPTRSIAFYSGINRSVALFILDSLVEAPRAPQAWRFYSRSADLESPYFHKYIPYRITRCLLSNVEIPYFDMSSSLFQSSRDYRALIYRLNKASPGYEGLDEFVNVKKDTCQRPPKFTVLTINPNERLASAESSISIQPFEGTTKLAKHLLHLQDRDKSCNIFLVENVCPESVALLGGFFDINPQFWADHVKNGDWFKDSNLMDQLPALPSSQKWHDFLQVRFVQSLTVSKNPAFKYVPESGADLVQDPALDYLVPDKSTTRLPRKAGKLTPLARTDDDLDFLLCTKQSITVWCGKRSPQHEGWNAVFLIDAPFQLPPGRASCGPPVYRSFMRRPTLADPSIDDIGPHATNREALIRHLKERLSSDSLRTIARSDCFYLLGDLYQLAGSNWMVINEYINREITTIEYKLEREEPNFRDLEAYLKELYIHRRRITRYIELIDETKDQCSKRGPRAWPRDLTSQLAGEQARDWEEDFANLHAWFHATSLRMEKNIRLLTALVAIGEGKQSLVENHGIARLSLLAMVFLPFSSVATILGIQGSFAPGEGNFWLFWVVAIALTAFVVGAFLFYDRVVQRLKVRFGKVVNVRGRRTNTGNIDEEKGLRGSR